MFCPGEVNINTLEKFMITWGQGRLNLCVISGFEYASLTFAWTMDAPGCHH